MRHLRRIAPGLLYLGWLVFTPAAALAAPQPSAIPSAACGHAGEIDLQQNWSPQTKTDFWFSSQGSQIMPAAWFYALEQPTGMQPFIDPCHMESFGFLSVPGSKLPIGFAEDKTGTATTQIGLTCAACHTGRLKIGDK